MYLIVQIEGQALLPSSAMAEASAAACLTLLDIQQRTQLTLCNTCVNPVLLVKHSAVLEVNINYTNGDMQMQTVTTANTITLMNYTCGLITPAWPDFEQELSHITATDRMKHTTNLSALLNTLLLNKWVVVSDIFTSNVDQHPGYCLEPTSLDAICQLACALTRRSASLKLPNFESILIVQSKSYNNIKQMSAAQLIAAKSGDETHIAVKCSHTHHTPPQQCLFALRKIQLQSTGNGDGNSDIDRQQQDWLYCLEWTVYGNVTAALVFKAAEVNCVQLAMADGHASTVATAIAVGQQAYVGGAHCIALLTRGALSISGAACVVPNANLQAIGIWAFARTIAQESRSIDVQALDLQQQYAGSHEMKTALLAATSITDRLLPAQVHGSAFGHTLQGGTMAASVLQRVSVNRNTPATLLFNNATSLTHRQVVVAVKAIFQYSRPVHPLHFSDSPGESSGLVHWAGIIVASDPDEDHLRPGDSVFGLNSCCIGAHIQTCAQNVFHVSRPCLMVVWCLLSCLLLLMQVNHT